MLYLKIASVPVVVWAVSHPLHPQQLQFHMAFADLWNTCNVTLPRFTIPYSMVFIHPYISLVCVRKREWVTDNELCCYALQIFYFPFHAKLLFAFNFLYMICCTWIKFTNYSCVYVYTYVGFDKQESCYIWLMIFHFLTFHFYFPVNL